jgi:hypothetical protein
LHHADSTCRNVLPPRRSDVRIQGVRSQFFGSRLACELFCSVM